MYIEQLHLNFDLIPGNCMLRTSFMNYPDNFIDQWAALITALFFAF